MKRLLSITLIIGLGLSLLGAAPTKRPATKATATKATATKKAQPYNINRAQPKKVKEKKEKKPKIDPEEMAKAKLYYSKPKSGIFVGVGVGASVITRNATIEETTSKQSGDMSLGLGINWDAKLGWRQYFSQKMGFRIYASYDQTWGFPGQLHTLGLKRLHRDYVFMDRILLNADYLLDLLAEGKRRVTVYVGVYGGYAETNQKYSYKSSTDKSNANTGLKDLISNDGNNYDTGYVFGFNAGMAITFVNHHTIEIGAKIPMYDIISQEYYEPKYGQDPKISDTYWHTPTFSVGYSFVF